MRGALGWAAVAVWLAAWGAAAECRIVQRGELKVEANGLRPTVDGDIDGHPIRILLDTGAWSNGLMESTANRLGLRLNGSPVRAYGAGGTLETRTTVVPHMHIGGMSAGRMLLPVTMGGQAGKGVDMLLGDEFFNDYDTEFDLQHGAIRLLAITGCGDDEVPYWSKGTYTLAPLIARPDQPSQPYIVGVKLNGRYMEALIDSGAAVSFATPAALQIAGAHTDAAAGEVSGVGGQALESAVARLDTFSVGDETIRNPKLREAALNSGVAWQETGSRIARAPADPILMLLGADFLRSHRIILSRTRGKAYFTYVGGPVFVTDLSARPVASPPPGPTAGASPGLATPPG